MSINKLLMVATVLIGLSTSCADNDKSPSVSADPLTFKLTLSTPNTKTAITDVPTTTTYLAGEKTINNLEVGLFDAAGNVVSLTSLTGSQVTSGSVVVIGNTLVTKAAVAVNVPSTKFSNVKKLSDFRAVQANLDNTTNTDPTASTGNTQLSNALPMIGEGDAQIVKTTGTAAATGSVSVTLNYLVSKIILSHIGTSFTGDNVGASFTPLEVFMGNVASTANCNGSSPTVTSPSLLHGEQVSTVWSWTSRTEKDYLGTGSVTIPFTSSAWDGNYTFYVFPNNNTTYTDQTTLYIKGYYKKSGETGNGTIVYYPIIINKSGTGITFTGTTASDKTDGVIPNNKVYNLSATITSMGTIDPTRPFNQASIRVTISVANWSDLVTQNTTLGPTSDPITVDGTTFLYSDGTWGKTVPAYSSSTPSALHVIGVVFSNTTSAADQARGWSHGYAMALKNAASSVTWGAAATTVQVKDYPMWVDFIKDKDGYTETQYVQSTKGPLSTSTYPAFYYATQYGTTNVTGTTQYAKPTSSTSGWYLPSPGQQYDVAINLGGMGSITPTIASGGGYGWWSNGQTGTSSSVYLCVAAFNSILNTLKNQGYSVDNFTANNNELYWAATESGPGNAFLMSLINNVVNLGDVGKTNSNSVRPVIAF